ncbi:hypothetical protein CDL15_Pgr014155 [Punica granatum]|uniref:Uncharacterized protein n=1 Tax=Punica granatum TaxID=22663 RepID=A0A218XH93_PUNGR|nr:hypothetical protein CDL15_Pgr014155 [Punica granatum]
MFYLASGYEERVGEVFESRVTQLNAWKDIRVKGQHVPASLASGWTCTGVHRRGGELRRTIEHAGRLAGRQRTSGHACACMQETCRAYRRSMRTW